MTDTVRTSTPKILDIIKASKNVLLHCHPFPDPDSVASALATKAVLEQLGKNVTIIRGDSVIPEAFSHFPGFAAIVPKNYFQIDPAAFDLFIIQDSAAADRISSLGPITFPTSMKTVVIDHHVTNTRFAKDVNLVDPSYPATALMLYDLFKLWNVTLTPDIAADLFIGMYTDTGGFKYAATTPETLLAAAELVKVYPDFHKLIFTMENVRRPGELVFQGIALSHIQTFFDGRLAVSTVSYENLKEKGLSGIDTSSSVIANLLKSVVGWDIGACLVENEPGKVKVSFRTRDSEKYDLSLIAVKLGGGGHKAAAAAALSGTIEEVTQRVVDAARITVLQ